jgi:signal transduction histidine kinase
VALQIDPWVDAGVLSGAYAGRMVQHAGDEVPYSAAMRRITLPACAVVVVLVMLGVIHGMTGQPAPEVAVTAVALAVALGGIGWALAGRPAMLIPDLVPLLAVGLAGAVLVGLQPPGPGYLVIFVVLLGLGMRLAPPTAFVTGLVVFAAANASALLSAKLSAGNLVSEDVGAAFLFAVGVFTRSTRVAQAKARAAQDRAEELLVKLRTSQAAQAEAIALTERARLAREVHDILAHSLAGLVLALDTAELLGRRASAGRLDTGRLDTGRLNTGEQSAGQRTLDGILEQVARAQRLAREGLADTRRAISALRGDELPGPALLDRLVRGTSEATGIRAALTVTGDQRPLSPEVGLALYRTAQEALINTAKYAGADAAAELRLSYGSRDVELEIRDARSPDVAPPGPAGLTFGGYGLTGMRERAELLGGTLTAGPTQEGFRVMLRLPASVLPYSVEAV